MTGKPRDTTILRMFDIQPRANDDGSDIPDYILENPTTSSERADLSLADQSSRLSAADISNLSGGQKSDSYFHNDSERPALTDRNAETLRQYGIENPSARVLNQIQPSKIDIAGIIGASTKGVSSLVGAGVAADQSYRNLNKPTINTPARQPKTTLGSSGMESIKPYIPIAIVGGLALFFLSSRKS